MSYWISKTSSGISLNDLVLYSNESDTGKLSSLLSIYPKKKSPRKKYFSCSRRPLIVPKI